MQKFDKLIDRLTAKVEMSATPVKGFVVGLSGTDSIVTYILLNEVAKRKGFDVVGVHYVEGDVALAKTTFMKYGHPWLMENFPKGVLVVGNPRGSADQYRWAGLHEYALNFGRFWLASTVNATEQQLGTFEILANSASIKPIVSLFKSEVLQVCEEYGVPKELINASRVPDCACGRDEFAAENIELIDECLRNNLSKDYPGDLLKKAMDYIRDTKRANDFKTRTPYNV